MMPGIGPDTSGVFVIAVTPFNDDASLDTEGIPRLVDFYLEKGADGLTILGMMGEAPRLTLSEALAVARKSIDWASPRPVVVGVSSPGLAAMAELSKAVMDLGAAGVMVAPPGTLRTDDQIVEYYAAVVEAIGSDVPLVLQDFPFATGVTISSPTLGRIVEALPSVVMLKHEDWPGLQKISDLRAAEARGRRRLSILCGNGGLFLPEEMERGADGAMTGFGYPEMMVETCRLTRSGAVAAAQDRFDCYLPLMRYEQQPGLGLAVRKHVLALRGAIADPMQRAPGKGLNAAAIGDVERLIERQERRLYALYAA